MNPYHHLCRPECECEGRRALTRMNRTVDLVIWLGFFLVAVLSLWRFG